MCIPIDPTGETLAWGINITLPDRTRAEWAEFERSGEAARVAKKDYEEVTMQPLRSMLDNAKEEEAKIWSTYSIGDIKRWSSAAEVGGKGRGRVVLMGDAAHGMPPNGLGSAMAFEDAATLARLLSENEDEGDTVQSELEGDGKSGDSEDGAKYRAITKRFEELRRPRIAKIGYGGKKARGVRGKSGDWVWWAKKWAFRGYFWWKGGVIVHVADDGFDIDTIDVRI